MQIGDDTGIKGQTRAQRQGDFNVLTLTEITQVLPFQFRCIKVSIYFQNLNTKAQVNVMTSVGGLLQIKKGPLTPIRAVLRV
jgi:hypothetical protein